MQVFSKCEILKFRNPLFREFRRAGRNYFWPSGSKIHKGNFDPPGRNSYLLEFRPAGSKFIFDLPVWTLSLAIYFWYHFFSLKFSSLPLLRFLIAVDSCREWRSRNWSDQAAAAVAADNAVVTAAAAVLVEVSAAAFRARDHCRFYRDFLEKGEKRFWPRVIHVSITWLFPRANHVPISLVIFSHSHLWLFSWLETVHRNRPHPRGPPEKAKISGHNIYKSH